MTFNTIYIVMCREDFSQEYATDNIFIYPIAASSDKQIILDKKALLEKTAAEDKEASEECYRRWELNLGEEEALQEELCKEYGRKIDFTTAKVTFYIEEVSQVENDK